MTAGGDYLLALKGNQSSLHTQVKAAFSEARDEHPRTIDETAPPRIASDTQVDGGHGRIETRKAEVLTDFGPWVPAAAQWPALACLIAITATREDLTHKTITTETRHYLSSRALTPTQANARVRAHWAIENRLHGCLDLSFGQDGCRIRTGHATENFAVVRHFALNVLRAYSGDKLSIPRRRRLCDFYPEYRERVLRGVGAP